MDCANVCTSACSSKLDIMYQQVRANSPHESIESRSSFDRYPDGRKIANSVGTVTRIQGRLRKHGRRNVGRISNRQIESKGIRGLVPQPSGSTHSWRLFRLPKTAFIFPIRINLLVNAAARLRDGQAGSWRSTTSFARSV